MAFHPYPQVIAAVFNRRAFGPPRGLTPASACPRIAHPASRPRRGTQVALLRLAFAPAPFRLTSPRASDSLAHSTKGTPSHRCGCSGCSWARGFRRCFTPLSGCFSPFPRGTGSLSVAGECSALEGGPPCFARGFTCPALLWVIGNPLPAPLRVRGSHPVPPAFPGRSPEGQVYDSGRGVRPPRVPPSNPGAEAPARCDTRAGLGWPGFARRYSRDLG